MNYSLLYRKDRYNEEEHSFAVKSCPTVEIRSKCPSDSTVIGRYSVLPYYQELESDLAQINSKLINSYSQHRWIASFDYYDILKEYTAESWGANEFPYSTYEGPFVVKGCTNSKKHKWKTHMFAENRREAVEVACRIMDDSHYENQEIIYRKYIPLKKLEDGATGIPFSNEWRFFFLGDQLVDYGYYWSIAEHPEKATITKEGIDFAQNIANIASKYVNFFVVDVAEKEDGDFLMIELNDGQMSGLSTIDEERFYKNLNNTIGGLYGKNNICGHK